MAGVEGRVIFNRTRIELRADLAPTRLRSVLWHEILHAVWEVACLPSGLGVAFPGTTIKDVDETIVEALSGRTLDVIRRNPELMRYLMREGA
jgi:hypothetical protein